MTSNIPRINVNRSTNDQFYRYKMEKLVAKVEGTGNGIKTVLVNVSAIARALDRPSTYITKFFGHELGAQTQMYPKEDKYIVNGAHDSDKLQTSLDVFIRRFVLCSKCDNPETRLIVRQRNGGEIQQACAACGHKGTILSTAHRVASYIIKNPPETDKKSKGTTGDTKTKEKGKKSSKNADSNRDSDEGSPHGQNGKTNGVSKSADDDDNEDWGDDDEIQNTRPELDTQIKGMIQTDDLEKSVDERCEKLRLFIEERKDGEKLKNLGTVKEILSEAERLEITENAPFVAALALFTVEIFKEVDEYKLLFQKLCEKNSKGQRYLLNALESLCFGDEKIREKLFNTKSMARLLMKFYDFDIVEEENFFIWNEKPMKRFSSKTLCKEIRDFSKDFLVWLENAEESSDEDSVENGDKLPEPEIDFTPTASNGLEVKIETTRKAPVEEKIEIDGEIIDVDDI